MTDFYLIAHKVRGEPAFDIAIKMDVETDDEPWWIIPTSGHRAYPYWSTPLAETYYNGLRIRDVVPEMPEDAVEHYEIYAAPREEKRPNAGIELLYKLGLRTPMVRRL